jgi:hypothetical protein
MDPAVARFIAIHHRSARESAEDDCEQYRGRTLEQAWRDLAGVCRTAMQLLAMNSHRERILAEQDPPHPSYFEIMRRLKDRG